MLPGLYNFILLKQLQLRFPLLSPPLSVLKPLYFLLSLYLFDSVILTLIIGRKIRPALFFDGPYTIWTVRRLFLQLLLALLFFQS